MISPCSVKPTKFDRSWQGLGSCPYQLYSVLCCSLREPDTPKSYDEFVS